MLNRKSIPNLMKSKNNTRYCLIYLSISLERPVARVAPSRNENFSLMQFTISVGLSEILFPSASLSQPVIYAMNLETHGHFVMNLISPFQSTARESSMVFCRYLSMAS